MEDARLLNSSSDDRKNQGSDHISTDHHDAGVEGCGREISCSVWKRAICTWHVFSCPTQHSSLHVIAHFPPCLFLTILKVNHLHLVTSGMGGCAVWGFICLAACLSGGPRTPSPTGQVVTVPSLSPCPLPPRSCSAAHATCEEGQDGLPRATLKEVCGQRGPRDQ